MLIEVHGAVTLVANQMLGRKMAACRRFVSLECIEELRGDAGHHASAEFAAAIHSQSHASTHTSTQDAVYCSL